MHDHVMALLALTTDGIARAVTTSAYHKGYRYYQQRRARVMRISADGREVAGTVQGSDMRPYNVNIVLESDDKDGDIEIAGSCSCPMAYNCKHVVALLMAAMDQPMPRGGDGPAARLSPELGGWLASLDLAAQSGAEEYPPDIRQRLLYVLSVSTQGGVPQVRVQPLSVRLLKDGRISERVSNYDVGHAVSGMPAMFLRPSDRRILRALYHLPGRSYGGGPGGYVLVGEQSGELLGQMIGTGRCRWQSQGGPALSVGERRGASGLWTVRADGSQQFEFALEGGAVVLPTAPPWYVDAATSRCGPLDTGLSPALAAALLKAPPVAPSEVEVLREALRRRLPDADALAPRPVPTGETVAVRPAPHLRLTTVTLRRALYYAYGWSPSHGESATATAQVARMSFDYNGHRIAPGERLAAPTMMHKGRLIRVQRRQGLERKAMARLRQFNFGPISATHLYERTPETEGDFLPIQGDPQSAWLEFVHVGVPALRVDGWTVEIDDDFPIRIVEAEGEWDAEIQEGSGIDWFELHLGVMIDGKRVDLLPALIGVLRNSNAATAAMWTEADKAPDGTIFVKIEDGRLLPLPMARFRPLLRALYELYQAGGVDSDGRVRFSTVRAAELAALEEATAAAARLRWLGGERLRELGKRLRDFRGIAPAPIPGTFRGTLRPYQRQGVDWLQFLREYGFGGVLADDMGLGKTVQALAHLAIEKQAGRMDRPGLVVAPTSLMANWRLEAERFVPDFKVLTLHGADRKQRFAAIPDHDLILTTYPLLARDRATLTAHDYHAVILDEAQVIKNPQTAAAQIVGLLRARHRLCLTGTPVENHLGELWSQFNFLNPGLLGERQHFTQVFRTPIEKLGDKHRGALLRRRVRPFLLRRTKAQVAAELPPKTEIVESVEMESEQRDLYDSVRLAMHKRVRAEMASRGLARSHIVVLDALLKMRQVCCDPRLLKIEAAAKAKARAAKLARLMEMLTQMIEEGRRILLFSQFTSMLALIEAELAATNIPYVLLTGDTKDRETPIRAFQAGRAPLFLISLKAGGTGLNLTAADTVILYDPWWNPAVEAQAMDRAHRIGQDKAVFVYKLVTLASIEEKMIELQARKRALADALFDPDAKAATDITEADIEFLFAA